MKKILDKIILLFVVFTFLFPLLTGCSGNSIVGTWTSEAGDEVLIFNNDGTCSVPFTYDAGWLEDCDRYSIDGEGKLVLSSSKGNIRSWTFTKKDSEEIVRDDGGYYLSGDTLVMHVGRQVIVYKKS